MHPSHGRPVLETTRFLEFIFHTWARAAPHLGLNYSQLPPRLIDLFSQPTGTQEFVASTHSFPLWFFVFLDAHLSHFFSLPLFSPCFVSHSLFASSGCAGRSLPNPSPDDIQSKVFIELHPSESIHSIPLAFARELWASDGQGAFTSPAEVMALTLDQPAYGPRRLFDIQEEFYIGESFFRRRVGEESSRPKLNPFPLRYLGSQIDSSLETRRRLLS